jgi:hypothetical protein
MLRFDDHFDGLFFTESVLSAPIVDGNTIRVAVRGLFPIKDHPLVSTTKGPVSGILVFEGVSKSERIFIEYIGDPRKPEGFREPRRESDGPFAAPIVGIQLNQFGFEGFWEMPPAWVDDWVIEARKFALEVTECNGRTLVEKSPS